MKDEWWSEVERIYHAARELHGEERSRFLAAACEHNSEMSRRVDEMLRNEEEQQSFLAQPAIAVVASSLVSQCEPVLAEGSQLGPYRVLGAIGRGGMGLVCRARDTRLNRDVAIKTLSEQFASDSDRMARFDREAKVLASLNHPNIGSIHDVIEREGCRYLVLELVDGITLAERLREGPCTAEEAVKIGVQIAEALEVAHERGIVHRDLKPANIKVTAEGKVKVLDFGLAKTFQPADSSSDASAAHTRPGEMVGTPAYMSPEQARAHIVDRRTDVWAFGCVMYELLTGRKAFTGGTASDTIAGILVGDVDWTALPPTTSARLQRLLGRCLNKDVRHRFQDAGDMRIELEEIAGGTEWQSQTVAGPGTGRQRFLWMLIASLSFLVLVLWFRPFSMSTPAVSAKPIRFLVYPPEGYSLASSAGMAAVSPDGRHVAFPVRRDGNNVIAVRDLDSTASRVLNGTSGGGSPFWSADSRSVGFVTQDKLKISNLSGGDARILCDAVGFPGATWNQQGTILFFARGAGLNRVSQADGRVELLDLDGGIYPEGPTFLPDGRHFIFNGIGPGPGQTGLYLGTLGSREYTRLRDVPLSARFAPPGYLVFDRNGGTYAQPFDTLKHQLTGSPVPLDVGPGGTDFSFSDNGVMALKPALDNQLVLVDRRGNRVRAIGPPGKIRSLEPSHDGKTVAVGEGTRTLRLIDVERDVSSPWTSSKWAVDRPLWSQDDKRIVFGSLRGASAFNLYEGVRQLSGDDAELLYPSPSNKRPADWSFDDSVVLYEERDESGSWDLWTLSLPSKEVKQLTHTPLVDEAQAQFSPNAKFIAYASNESGEFEVWLRDLSGSFKKVVSTRGGVQPRWNSDGTELFYIASDQNLMSVRIRDRSLQSHPDLDIGKPTPLFKTALFEGAATFLPAQYAVHGQGFIMNVPVGGPSKPITVILNWTALLDGK